MAISLLRRLARLKRSRKSTAKPRRAPSRPRVEALEDRLAPAIHTWLGLSNNLWTNGANWDIGAPDSTDDILVFKLGSLNTSNVNNFPTGTQFAEIRLEGGYTVSGVSVNVPGIGLITNRLRVGAGGITSSNVNLIQANLEFVGATPIDVGSGTLQIGNATGGSIAGAGGIVKDGAGKLILGRANSYTGATQVTEGVLTIQSGGALGSTASGTTVAGGATLELQPNPAIFTVAGETLTLAGSAAGGPATLRNVTGNNTWSGQVVLVNSAVVNVSSGPFAISGVISNGTSVGSLTKEGAGTLTLAGSTSNTYAGATTVNAGTLALDKRAGFIPTAVAGPLVVGDGSGSDVVLYLNGGPQVAGPITVNRSGLLNVNNQSTALTNRLTLNGGQVATGTGSVFVQDVTATSVGGTAAAIGGNLSGFFGSPVRFEVLDGPAEVDLLVSAVVGDAFFPSVPVVKDGPGRMQFSAANIYGGATTINAGALRITNGTALGPAGSLDTTVNPGGTLEVVGPLDVAEGLTLNGTGAGGSGALVALGAPGVQTRITQPVALAGNTTVRADGTLTFAATLSGNFDLTKTGAGALNLSVANPNFGGALAVQQGAVRVDNAQGLGSSAAGGGTVVQSGTSLVASFTGTSNEPLTLNGAGTSTFPGALFGEESSTLSGSVTLAGNTTIAGDFLTLSGGVSGPFDLTVGVGAVSFTGATPNTYGGVTRVAGGTLTLAKPANTNAVPGALAINSGVVLVNNPGQIPDAAPVTIENSSVALPGLLLQADEAIGPLTLNNGAVQSSGRVLTLTGDVTASGASVLASNVALAAGTHTVTVAADGVLRAAINRGVSGPGGLTKAGEGRLDLQGQNSFTGATTVSAGTLFAGGNMVSPITVNAGGTLSGSNSSGFFTRAVGDVTVNAGGTLDPGGDPFNLVSSPAGILNATGAVTLNPASTFHVDVGGTTPGGHDQLKLQGAGTLNLGDADLDLAFFGGFQSAVNTVYTIVQNDTGNPTVGAFTDPATGAPIEQGGTFVVGGVTFRINYSGGDFNDVIVTHINTPSQAEDLALTPATVAVGGDVTLTGRLTDPDALDGLTLIVDWGDSSAPEERTGVGREPFAVPHQYQSAGDYTVRVTWLDEHGGGRSRDLAVTVVADAAPAGVESVVVNDGSAQRSMVRSLTVTFDGAVTPGDGAFTVRGQDGSLIDVQVVSRVIFGGRTVSVIAFTGDGLVGGSLADGNYTLTIDGGRILDAAGRALDADGDGPAGGERVEVFFRLYGDGDGDRDVDVRDLIRFAGSLGKKAGDAGFLSFFDHEADGDVDRADLLEFIRRFGSRLPE